MKWKNRLTNYNFWISIVSAALLLLQAFDFEFDILYVNEILTAILGLLVVIGIITDPTKSSVESSRVENVSPKANVETNLPTEEKVQDIKDSNESDLQVIINKIKEDLDAIRFEMNSPISSPLNGEDIEGIRSIVNE